MSRRELPSWTLPVSWVCLVAWAVAMALALAGCSTVEQGSTWPESAEVEQGSTWPESTEFSELETGQDRFSTHDTNLDTWRVLVDHETGVQYIVGNTVHTVCPLLDVDGTPLLVAEAGE